MASTLLILGLLGGLLGGPPTATKTATVVSDPVNGFVAPKAIPGATVQYTVTVTNSALYQLDSGTVTITDAIPANTKLYVGDIGATGSGPILTLQGSIASGLSTVYLSLGSATDDIDFSKDGGATYAYTPIPDASGCDAAVTNIRIKTHGKALIGGVYLAKFRVIVK